MALGQNLILYVLVLSVERVMKFMREVFLVLGIPLCPTIKIYEVLFCAKLTSGAPFPQACAAQSHLLTAPCKDLGIFPFALLSLAIFLKVKEIEK